MTNYVIKLSNERLCDMCVCVCVCVRERERDRDRGTYTYEHETRWGMINYIKKHHQVTKIPTMRYI